MKKFIFIVSMILGCSACQNTQISSPQLPSTPVHVNNNVPTPDGIVITPYEYPEIKREKIILP